MMRRMLLVAILVGMVGTAETGRASQEAIHPWERASVTAMTNLLGRVTVTAEAASGRRQRLASLEVRVRGATLQAPRSRLDAVPALQLSTLEIRTERGYDPQPWLYVVFRAAPPLPANAKQQWVYFAFQGGAFKKASTRTLTPDGQYRFEDR